MAEHLRVWSHFQKQKYELFFWRTRAGLEVDFILYGPDSFVAMEVKNSTTIKPSDMRGLKEFFKDYPEALPIFLYRGEKTIKKEQILCIPVEKFLSSLDRF